LSKTTGVKTFLEAVFIETVVGDAAVEHGLADGVAARERDEVGSVAELKPAEEVTQLGDGIEGAWAWGGAHGPGAVEAASGVSPRGGPLACVI
jgi:hypothetical protein